jgi:hypothetical protein
MRLEKRKISEIDQLKFLTADTETGEGSDDKRQAHELATFAPGGVGGN